MAHRQKRQFALLPFDAQVKHEYIVKPGESLPEDALFIACAGGTDIGRVLIRALGIIQNNEGSMKKADVVLITDGASEENNAPYIRQLAAGLGVTMLGFGIGVNKSDLDPWCDEVQEIKDLNDLNDSTAEKIFSV